MIFSKERVNTGRQLELDIARGLAVLFMIFIHSQLFFANDAVVDSAFGAFNDFVGMVPSAPMFMFLLGVGINYTRKNDPKVFFKRGVMLILAGYLLNFLKGFVPCIINAYRTMDIAYLYEGITELMYVDILHFSGLAMIMFGVFKLLRANTLSITLTGFALASINIFVLSFKPDNFWLASVTGLFWGTSEYSYFPFLTWAFYPIMGFVFGSFLIRCTNKKKFYAILMLISSVVFFGGSYYFNVWLGLPNGMVSDHGYYHHILTDNITFTALVVLEISVLSFIAPKVPGFLEKIIARWSKNVTPIFFIHWLIITWSALFIPLNSLNMVGFIFLLIMIVPASDLLAYIYGKIKNRQKEKSDKNNKSKNGTIIISIFTAVLVSMAGIYVFSNVESNDGYEDYSATEEVENEDMEEFIYTGTVNASSGEPDGIGKAYYPDGSIYEGGFKEGLRQGQGLYVGADGEEYKGAFEEDDYNGYGEYKDPDGSTYVGEFEDGDFHGEGTLTNTDGSLESGIWNKGNLETSATDQEDNE